MEIEEEGGVGCWVTMKLGHRGGNGGCEVPATLGRPKVDEHPHIPAAKPISSLAGAVANEPGATGQARSTHRRPAASCRAINLARAARVPPKAFQQDLSPHPALPAFPQMPRGFPAARENKRRCFLLSPPPAWPRLSGSNPPWPPPLHSQFSSHPHGGRKGTNLFFLFFLIFF